jgi:hypothetical protein
MQSRGSGLKSLLLCSLTAVLATGRAPGAPATAGSTPGRLSAQQVVAKNIAARGGLEAWRKVQTMVWSGHIESAHAVVPSMLFMLSQQRPNKMRFEINAMGDRTLRVFDGTQGWKLHPAHGRPEVQPYTIEEVRFAQSGPGLDGPLIDYADKGRSVSLVGIDDIDKHNAYHLIVRTASGESQHVWVDAKSFLEIRYDRPAGGPAGASRTVSVLYRDYRTTDGLTIPSIIETAAGPGTPPDRMVIERVTLNPALSNQTFRVPGQQPVRDRVPFPSPRRRVLPDGVLPSPLAKPTPAPASAPSATGEDPGSTSQ